MSTYNNLFNVQGASQIVVPSGPTVLPPVQVPINGGTPALIPVPAPGMATGYTVVQINGASSVAVPNYP